MCECIVGWWSVLYHLWVTVTFGAKRIGYRGETSRHQIWGETTRGETTRGELVLGRNDLLPFLWRSVTYHFWVTLTLTSDLVCRLIVSRTYLLYYLRGESQICCMLHLWMLMCRIPILGHCDLDLRPSF